MVSAFVAVVLAIAADVEPVDWRAYASEAAPRAWAKFEERAKRLQGSWSRGNRSSTTNEIVPQYQGEVKHRQDCELDIFQPIGDQGEVKGFNPRYQFTLVRTEPEKPWTVKDVGPLVSENGSPLAAIRTAGFLMRPCRVDGIIEGATNDYRGPSRTIFDPAFALHRVTPIEEEGRRLCKIDFSYTPQTKPYEWPILLLGGSLFLDPDHYWVIRRCEAHTGCDKGNQLEGTEIVDFDYRMTDDGFPILQRITEKRSVPAADIEVEIVRDYKLEERDVPESEFTLSAFGFAEPPEPGEQTRPPKPTPWYLWIGLSGGVVLLAAVFFFWRAKRARAAAPSPLAPGQAN